VPQALKTRASSKAKLSRGQLLLIGKALSDPRRLGILERIARCEQLGCADLRECIPISAATLSHHLKELEVAGLIETRREGKFVMTAFRRDIWNAYLAKLQQF
jgi:ArsR family transcriptional regulator, arsenate/arsenite/antimonite-responsive transcriptional repressor